VSDAAAEASPYPLERLLPPEGQVDADGLLEAFLAYVEEIGVSLYPAQEEAILELLGGSNVILATPTGSGKSLVAAAQHFQTLAEGGRCYYTAPIKALVSEKFFDLCRIFGPDNVGMMTGDASVNRDASIVCCTAEILASIALREGPRAEVDRVCMDEFHYYGDSDRGVAWQVPLLELPQARFLLMSATLGDTSFLEDDLAQRTGAPVRLVKSTTRPVPLEFSYRMDPLQETIHELVEEGRAPVYIVHFTQRQATEQAQNLMSLDVLTKEEKQRVKDEVGGFSFDSPFGKDLRRWVHHGIGVHHAGLLPKYRRLVERLAQKGLLKLICGTDTLGVGVNVPIRTVLFTRLCKFDGRKTRILSVRSFQQIAGRAGRRGYDDRGFVVCQAPEHVIENERLRAKAGGDPKKLRKTVFKKPPDRGFANWDEATFERLIHSEPEKLESRFTVSHGMLLAVLSRPDGCREMKALIRKCHEPRARKFQHGRQAIAMLRSLLEAEVVEIVAGGSGARIRVNAELQEDFSLNQVLSLFVVEAAEKLQTGGTDRDDPGDGAGDGAGEDDPSDSDGRGDAAAVSGDAGELPPALSDQRYALDLLTLVEATLEDPGVVLMKQVDKLKTEALAQMKADGLEYDERMAKLDEIGPPQPNAEFLYAAFDEFARKNPWVRASDLAPKSIARDMVEQAMSFREYVREYGLARSEGVLLRYLSDAYKGVRETVPDTAKTRTVDDLEDWLGATVRGVDSSLIDEWERLVDPEAVKAAVRAGGDAPPPGSDRAFDVTADRKTFLVLLRNAVWRLVHHLSRGQYDRVAEAVGSPAGSPDWYPNTVEEAFAPFWERHDALLTDADARSPRFLRVDEEAAGPDAWRLTQTLRDAEGDDDWFLELDVDLPASRQAGEPVLLLRRIGEG
jgi:superfamily II RNA helicase